MNAPHLPSDQLDLYALGSLAEAKKAQADAHLAACERCQKDLAELRADMQHFNQFVLPRTQQKVAERIARRPRFDVQRWMMPAFVAAGLMTAGIIFVPGKGTRPGETADGLGVKGGPLLQIYDLAPNAPKPVQLESKARVSPGDRLRFVAEPAGYPYLIVVSLDGSGEVSTFWPPAGQASGPVDTRKSELPDAIELDAAPGPERVFAYFSRSPLRLESIAAGIKAHPEAPPVPDGAASPVTFTLEKVSR